MAEERFAISFNLIAKGVTQYTQFPFNSFSKIGDRHFGVNEDGFYEIKPCIDAAGTNIDSHFVLFKSDFGIKFPKTLETLNVIYETSGTLILTITVDDECYQKYTLSPVSVNQKQHGNEVDIGDDLQGVIWEFKVENTEGCDYSFDFMSGNFNVIGADQLNTLR